MTFSPEAYLWFKTLHIVGVVVWFAGLFYLVRLFIYRHQDFFRRQYRLAMMARNLDRMAPDVLLAHQRRASDFLDALT